MTSQDEQSEGSAGPVVSGGLAAQLRGWRVGRRGWFALWYVGDAGRPSPPPPLYIRAREDGPRLAIAALLVEDDQEPVTGTRLRQIPVGLAEGMLAGVLREAVLSHLADDIGVADALAELRTEVDGTVFRTEEEVEALGARWKALRAGSEPPLLRPPATGGGDEFYAQVAAQYLTQVGLSRRPAAVLAEAAGVPVGTVHRWIRESRRRGLLPVGRRGKVG